MLQIPLTGATQFQDSFGATHLEEWRLEVFLAVFATVTKAGLNALFKDNNRDGVNRDGSCIGLILKKYRKFRFRTLFQEIEPRQMKFCSNLIILRRHPNYLYFICGPNSFKFESISFNL